MEKLTTPLAVLNALADAGHLTENDTNNLDTLLSQLGLEHVRTNLLQKYRGKRYSGCLFS